MKNKGIILIGFYVKGNPMTDLTVIRTETIHRLGVDIELCGDGQGFFHIVYKVEDRYGEHLTPLVDPIRCPIRAAEVYERELNLVHRARH